MGQGVGNWPPQVPDPQETQNSRNTRSLHTNLYIAASCWQPGLERRPGYQAAYNKLLTNRVANSELQFPGGREQSRRAWKGCS